MVGAAGFLLHIAAARLLTGEADGEAAATGEAHTRAITGPSL